MEGISERPRGGEWERRDARSDSVVLSYGAANSTMATTCLTDLIEMKPENKIKKEIHAAHMYDTLAPSTQHNISLSEGEVRRNEGLGALYSFHYCPLFVHGRIRLIDLSRLASIWPSVVS